MRKLELTDGLWIGAPGDRDGAETPTYLFKKKFCAQKEIKSAYVCASALGCYALSFNGQLVSEEYFAPGYSQYNRRVLYNRYDVTNFMRQGENEILAEVANGWYAGRLGLVLQNNCFGNKRAFRMALCLTYADGRDEVMETDETWLVSKEGPRKSAEFFDGEVYDARIRPEDISYRNVVCFENLRDAMCTGQKKKNSYPRIEPFDGAPVILHDRVKPLKISRVSDHVIQLDFGVNSAKVIALEEIELEEGMELVIRHGEVLDQKGRVYTNNLRSAKAEIRYTAKAGKQSYCPKFTYMGFRYVEIQVKTKPSETIAKQSEAIAKPGETIAKQSEAITKQSKGTEEQGGVVDRLIEGMRQNNTVVAYEIYSDMQKTGSFTCSNQMLNQLQQNIETSMRSNFIDIPTDCPQRDERSGWTGDIALFSSTACFNYDIKNFMNKWLRDAALAQKRNGVIPHVVPDNGLYAGIGKDFVTKIVQLGAAVWGDAVVLVPWNVYMETGDIQILKNQYAMMKKWVSYEEQAAARFSFGKEKYIWDKSFQYGDWLAPGESLIDNIKKGKWTATAYMANSVSIMEQAAKRLGKMEDAKNYRMLFQQIKAAFRKTFLDRNGHIKNGFQSIWVLAVWFHLLNGKEIDHAVNDLVEDIKKRDYHLATGFVGTPYLCFVLSDYGYPDIAYRLLLQETAPGWLYQIKCGATSVWERWDALREDGTVKDGGDAEMNMVSFNHYAYGAVGDWLYKRIAGLEPTEPGYQRFVIRPTIGGGLTSARVSHRCPYGEIISAWEIVGNTFKLDVQIPAGTVAKVYLPDDQTKMIPAGNYAFTCEMKRK